MLLKRRALLSASAALAASFAVDARADFGGPAFTRSAARSTPSLTHRYSFMPAHWFVSSVIGGSGLWGTQTLGVTCPDDFVAVRVGFANITATPFTITKVAVQPSSSFNDGINPLGGASPVTLTTLNAGADSTRVVTASGAPTTLTVAANATDATTGQTANPKFSWTDWCNVASIGADPVSGMRALMVRYTLNNGQTVTYCNGLFQGWTGVPAVNNGYDYFIGGYNNGTDYTNFSNMNAAAAIANSLVSGTIACCVQFMTVRPGIVGMNCGDSHHNGTTTTTSFNSYLVRGATAIGKALLNQVPSGLVTAANGGAITDQYFAWLRNLMPFIQPTYVILPGWEYNSAGNISVPASAPYENQFLTQLAQAADFCVQNGAVPIHLTAFPRDATTMAGTGQLAAWLAIRQQVLEIQNQGLVVDATPTLGHLTTGALDGTYIPALTTDNVHPNDAGHNAIAALTMPVIRSIHGL